MDIKEIISFLEDWGATKKFIETIWVFGSRARDDYTDTSDIDIAIELKRPGGGVLDESGGLATWMLVKKEWQKELSELIPFKIDLQQFRGDDTPTINSALQKSSIIAYRRVEE